MIQTLLKHNVAQRKIPDNLIEVFFHFCHSGLKFQFNSIAFINSENLQSKNSRRMTTEVLRQSDRLRRVSLQHLAHSPPGRCWWRGRRCRLHLLSPNTFPSALCPAQWWFYRRWKKSAVCRREQMTHNMVPSPPSGWFSVSLQ